MIYTYVLKKKIKIVRRNQARSIDFLKSVLVCGANANLNFYLWKSIDQNGVDMFKNSFFHIYI